MNKLKPDERDSIDSLLESLAKVYGNEGRPGGDAACAALRAAHGSAFRRFATSSDPVNVIGKASIQASALSMVSTILESWRLFGWANWEGEGLSDDVSSHLYTTELVGPDGHFNDNTVRIGLLVSDANTDYPISRHSGEETYFIISGTAEWSVDGNPYKAQAPGTYVHHPAWVPHGRRTTAEVFLGAWRWSGDLNLSSFSVDE